MKTTNTRKMASDAKFFEAYSRYNKEPETLNDIISGKTPKGAYESWDESVKRVMNMHREKYAHLMTPELESKIQFAQDMYSKQAVLGAQRALQFGGEQLIKHQIRLYNCVSSYADRPAFFGECMYMLLCGAGAGFSVQKHHNDKLPTITKRGKRAKTYVIDDSIEGWSHSIDVLLSSYFTEGAVHPEFKGCHVSFDYSLIRPKGAFISGGFKAPSAEPLRQAHAKIEALLEKQLETGNTRLRPIDVYDLVMFAADAVIAGGVRRSATICLFSHDDEEMMNAKMGDWFINNPQRGRSNNSAVIVRDEIKRSDFSKIMKSIKDFGEPAFIFTDNKDFTYNPCVEIGKYPQTKGGVSAWQGCNLSEINGTFCVDKASFLQACEAASIICTLQAGYTDFKFLQPESKEVFEGESLIGVSITGWMNNPQVLFDESNMIEGAELVKSVNKTVAKMIGINPAARSTCVKPSGNASVLLQTANGIHGEHSPYYLRHVQMNEDTEVCKLIMKTNPEMVEDSVWGKTKCIAFPVVSPKTSVYKDDLLGVKQLDYVKKAQQFWVEYGTDVELCRHPKLRHNVSNTITVDDWVEVEEYVFENRCNFAGISFLAASGDKAYPQAPNAQVLSQKEIVEKYGDAAFFASGLIVDGLEAFDNDLWDACSAVLFNREIDESKINLHKIDWVRRFNKFANNYFEGDLDKTSYCLKDVFYFHKWSKIQRNLNDIDWVGELKEKEFTDINTMAAAACTGAKGCEI